MHRNNGRIRVLRIISRLNVGGPARHVLILNSRLDPGAFDSILVTGLVKEYEGDMSYLAGEYSVRPLTIPFLGREVSLLDDIRSFFAILKVIRTFRPDVVHTHAAKAGALGRAAAALAGVPVVVHTFHGHVFKGYFGRAFTSLVLSIERILARRTKVIVTLSESQKREIADRFRVASGSRLRVIPLGLDLAVLRKAKRHSGTLRGSLGISEDVMLVGVVGRLVAIKDYPTFLRAACRVHRQQPEVRFVVVGDGEERSGLESLSEELGISHVVHFTGWVENMRDVYPDLDVLAMSSLNEGTPVSVIEAMACGCCVVATRAGGTVDVVRDGVDGITVPIGSPEALAEGLLRVLSDSGLRGKFGERARESSNRFAAERLVDDIERLYLELLNST